VASLDILAKFGKNDVRREALRAGARPAKQQDHDVIQTAES
jgi:hypothetical protein